jgi:hypothetical protein
MSLDEAFKIVFRAFIDSLTRAHTHKCGACGHTWSHGNECAGSTEAHTCTVCGNSEVREAMEIYKRGDA